MSTLAAPDYYQRVDMLLAEAGYPEATHERFFARDVPIDIAWRACWLAQPPKDVGGMCLSCYAPAIRLGTDALRSARETCGARFTPLVLDCGVAR